MNAVTPVTELPTEAARLVRAIVSWFPHAKPEAEWMKQATLALARYPLPILKAIHARGMADFKHFPSIPALYQLAAKVSEELSEKPPERERWSFEQDAARASVLAEACRKEAGWLVGYAEACSWIYQSAVKRIVRNRELIAEGKEPDNEPTVDALLRALPPNLYPPQQPSPEEVKAALQRAAMRGLTFGRRA